MKLTAVLLLFVLTIFCSCNNNDASRLTPGDSTVARRTAFFDKSGMDTAVSPAENFYNYANGGWIKNTVIPGDQSGWGSFHIMYEDNLKKLCGLAENAARSNPASGTIEQKVADYYASGMDTAAIEQLGATPLAGMLAAIDSIKNYKELAGVIARANAAGWTNLVGFNVTADEKNSARYVAIFSQAGLSLPEKNYYTSPDSAYLLARNKLNEYIISLFELTGSSHAVATDKAREVMSVETALAASHRSPAELRDPQKNYNKISLKDLSVQQPNLYWQEYFAAMGLAPDSVNMQQPDYYRELDHLFSAQPVSAWKSKLKFDYIAARSPLLSKSFRDARFTFSKNLTGQKKESERWKKMVQRTDEGIGELLGQLYIKKYFSAKAKSRMDELINNLQKAFEARMQQYDWMSTATKDRAKIKLNGFLKKIGFPEKWKVYDDVVIRRNDFFGNAVSIEKHKIKERIKKVGQPVDKSEWDMTPPTVNAYYNPTYNEIVFPAGILQFPFFDENADDAINYGGIGMVIGHEMTHAFDDQGSQYDEAGNMNNWWAKEDLANFKTKTGVVEKQYTAFKVLKTMSVNGSLTLGENLADIGGIAIAYDAFKLTEQGKGTTLIDGFTPDQRFFLSYAQIWRSKITDESARVRVNTDPHSPDIFRVNGPLSNFEPFYRAFNIKPGNAMYLAPADRARVW